MTEGTAYGDPDFGDTVYNDGPEDSPQLDTPDSLLDDDLRVDPLDTGYSPPDRDPGRVRELEKLLRNQRLLARPNVIFTPHVAFNSVEAVAHINAVTVENITGFLRGEPRNLVPL